MLPPPRRPRLRRAGRRRPVLLLALGLLVSLAILALTPMLARPPAGGERHSAAKPAGGYTAGPAGTAPPGGPVVQATEVTAPPSRTEPTDVVPSGAVGSPPAAIPGTPGPGTPASTAPPTPTAPPAPIAVEITCAEAVNNVSGQVCVHTAPGAALTITVTYCSGRDARNTDLQGTRYADNEGNYTWTWVPETTCPGTAVAHVAAKAPDGSAGATATFPVP